MLLKAIQGDEVKYKTSIVVEGKAMK